MDLLYLIAEELAQCSCEAQVLDSPLERVMCQEVC